mgnify:CR=1 FL=1
MARIESVLSKNKWELGIDRYELIMILTSFFLARVNVLEKLTPFGIAFLGSYIILKNGNISILFASILGTFSVQGLSGINYYIGAIILYVFFTKYKDNKEFTLISASTIVATIFTLVKLLTVYISKETYIYDFILIGFEGILLFTMTYIFLFASPIESLGKGEITNERLICSFITLALVLSGIGNVTVFGASLKNIISLSIIVYLSFSKGIFMGATSGVILGMVSYISNVEMPFIIAILGIGGLLAGLFRDIGKSGSIIGFILGNGIVSYYVNGLGTSFLKYNEIIIGSIIFIALYKPTSKYVEKIFESETKVKKDYENRKFELASKKLSNISDLIHNLSLTFSETIETKDVFSSYEIYNLIDNICTSKCNNCKNYNSCWKDDYYSTYYSLFTSMGIMDAGVDGKENLIKSIMGNCKDIDHLYKIINEAYDKFKEKEQLDKKLLDQRSVIVEQLQGLEKIVNDINLSVYKSPIFNEELEELLYKEIKNNRIDINDIIVAYLEGENIEIYIEFDTNNTMDKIEKVTKIVAESLGYPVVGDYSYGSITNSNKFKLIRVNRYGTLTKASNVICSEDGISGDNFTFGEVENTSFAAISDGMGIGKKASAESTTAIELLEKMMDINADREMTLKTINSVIRTKSTNEIFTTLDISFVDLFKGRMQIIKSGAPPTFIKRKDEIIMINSLSLPIGILKDVDFSIYEENIQDGDIIIMMSDGVLDCNEKIENPESWMKDIILNIDSQNPQTIADEIIDKAKGCSGEVVKDDMTVVVTKVWKN